ncbi:CPBP family glutamic-type intramembrane protease [Chiayiivirga flava]|uniref:CAAX prenyl protease 2/Lysostaphin resistance protein A-like domain-containing protein n=1 Tax=Chiayiivirga flava TaxID=659595 RepID=A0A7W8D625_9GAMM|nr:CPBP family glutamic-type intramembrane protease [Chiayiivirga flava]MBB5208603.1 hypothetical protein [Chiayiivirga flava]
MTAAPAPSGRRRALAAAVAALGVVLGFWALSHAIVATWLEREALQRAALWSSGSTPWRWAFSDRGAVIAPASRNLDILARDGDGLRVRVLPPAGSLALALHGERIDPALVTTASLTAGSDAGLAITLLGERDGTYPAWATAPLPPQPDARTLPLRAIGDAPLHGLQLHFETPVPAQVRLTSLALQPPSQLAPGVCATFESVDETLARCPVRLARFTAPPMATPERMLWWRDALLLQRPGSVVTAATGGLSLAALLPLDAVGALPWLLLLTAAVAFVLALATRRHPAARTRRAAAFELALALCVPVALLGAGWPGDDVPPPIAAVFVLALATACALRDPSPGWRVLGTVPAWRASAMFTLLAGLAVIGLGLLLGDGEPSRTAAPDRYWRYPLWAVLQQWLLLRTLAPRTRRLFADPLPAALAAGALFALLHLPNFGLMLATFAGGSAWAWLGYRHRALLPLAASHAVLGLLLVGHLPPWLLRSAEVGGRYLMAP